jgi:uncharacterized membrane protein (UPF0127 family)
MLVCDGRAVTSVEVARSRAARRRGLLGRDGIDGALLLAPARSVHTMSMRFAIDVAHLAADGTVLRITHMSPNRIGAPVWRARAVVEAEAGSFARWGLRPGSAVAVR